MPAKNVTKRPQHVIDEAVKRYLGGESAAVLAKYYKISKPGFYLWVSKYKETVVREAKRANMSPSDAETADKRVLMIELDALRAENRKLRELVLAKMLEGGK